MASKRSLNIGALIEAVRSELEASDDNRQKKKLEPLFVADELELEIHFVVEDTNKLDGGFDLAVVKLGADKGLRREETHTVRLKFKVPGATHPPTESRASAGGGATRYVRGAAHAPQTK